MELEEFVVLKQKMELRIMQASIDATNEFLEKTGHSPRSISIHMTAYQNVGMPRPEHIVTRVSSDVEL